MIALTMRGFVRALAGCCCLGLLALAAEPARAQNLQLPVGIPASFPVDMQTVFTLDQFNPAFVIFETTDPGQLMALSSVGLASPVTIQQLNLKFPGTTVSYVNPTFTLDAASDARFTMPPMCASQTATDCVLEIDFNGDPPAGFADLIVDIGVPATAIAGAGTLGGLLPAFEANFAAGLAGPFEFAVQVVPGAQSITFGAPPVVTVGGTGTVSATGGPSSSPVVFSSTTPGTCSVSGTTVTGIAIGTCTIAADQAADANYNAAPEVTQSITVGAFSGTRLANISTRMDVLTGNNVLIAGFIIGGTASKTVAITATGPSLAPFGIANPLANPTLTLVRQSDHAVIATNDDWQTDPNATLLQISGFAPTNPLEAALYISLPPGAYTAVVQGAGGTTGVSVVGVFEIDHPEVPLVNISTRGEVLNGNNVMIAGLIVQGTSPQKVVITATGPSLAPFGIANPLLNPTLTLVRQSDHAILGTNDDWQTNANAADIVASGFAPTDPHESALLVTLDPGAYTAIVSGVGGTIGVSVVGVFTVP